MLQAAAKRSTTSVTAVGKQDRHLLGRQRNRHAMTEHKRSKVSVFFFLKKGRRQNTCQGYVPGQITKYIIKQQKR